MGKLIAQRLHIMRPELARPPAAALTRAQTPGKQAGMVLDPVPEGLGDWVETWAKPIARWLDERVIPEPRRPLRRQGDRHREASRPSRCADPVLGLLVRLAVWAGWVTLPMAGCSACSRRRRWLNELVPVLRSWASWRGAPGRLWAKLRPPRPHPIPVDRGVH